GGEPEADAEGLVRAGEGLDGEGVRLEAALDLVERGAGVDVGAVADEAGAHSVFQRSRIAARSSPKSIMAVLGVRARGSSMRARRPRRTAGMSRSAARPRSDRSCSGVGGPGSGVRAARGRTS